MIDRMTPRTMILLMALAVVVVGLVGWFVFVTPERTEAASLQTEIELMQTRLEIAEKISADPNKLERQVALRQLETAMPEETRVAMPQVLRQLSEAARKANVRIRGVTPQPAVALTGYNVTPITLTVDGHYFGIANFIELLNRQAVPTENGLEASGRLFSVDSIILGAGATGPPPRGPPSSAPR